MKSICLSEGNNLGELNQKVETDFFWFSITSYGASDVYEKHYHENPYLSLLLGGPYTETNKGTTQILNGGEAIFRPALYDHSNKFCGKPGACFNIQFKNEWLRQLDFKFKLPSKETVYQCGSFPTLYRSFLSFKNNNADEATEAAIDWLVQVNSLKLNAPEVSKLSKVKAIIENEPETHHSLESLSARVLIHPVYLATAFKSKTGMTIGQFQYEMKLKKASNLLFNTKQNITDIAFACGFYDTAHFIKRFKNSFGVSPLQFRKQVKP